jgi:hypothetical protein
MTSDQSQKDSRVIISGSIERVDGDIIGGDRVGLDEAKTVKLLKEYGLSNDVISILTSFLPEFLGLLSAPRTTMASIVSNCQSKGRRLTVNAAPFGLISLVVSSILAFAWNVPEKPNIVDVTLVISALFIWVFVSLAIHIGLKIIGGKGTLDATVAAVIYASASVSLAAVPIIGAVSYLTTNTKVTLTYPYVVYYGYADWGLPFDRGEKFRESFIRENDPSRESTIVPPASLPPPRSVQRTQTDRRIPMNESTYGLPEKSLSAAFKPGFEILWLILPLSYFLAMYFYMASLLSVVHMRSTAVLFLIALLAPPTMFVAAIALFGFGLVIWFLTGLRI